MDGQPGFNNWLQLTNKLKLDSSVTNAVNLTDRFTNEDLDKIGMAIHRGFTLDKDSRRDWENRMEAGMDLAMQIQKEKNFPWPGASNVIFPLVTIASLQFSARSYENLVIGAEVVQYRVLGKDSDGKARDRADRISKHMSWQVLEQDTCWEEQHDRLLINLGIVGTNVVKTYYSSKVGHNVSELVTARDFVIDYWAKSCDDCGRKTQIVPFYRNEIYEKVKRGVFRDVLTEDWYQSQSIPETDPRSDIRKGTEPPQIADMHTPFVFLEQHCSMDFDQDGYAEPYIITIDRDSQKVLRIVARWSNDEDIERASDDSVIKIKSEEYFTKYGFIPASDGGFYDTGYGILLGPLNEAVNSGINQCIDAGTMHNSNGGFLGKGAKIRGGTYTFAPWEWKRIDATGDDLKKSMVPFPVREPSSVMFQLIGLIIEYSDRVAGTVDQTVGKSPGQNTPAETSRNTMEQGMRIYNSIFKRVWRSLKEEFKKLHQLNAKYMPPTFYFGEDDDVIRREDYKTNPDQVIPVADPNITSKAMRMQNAIMVREASMQVPGYDRVTVEKRFLKAAQVDGVDKVYPGPENVPPLPNPKAQIEEMKLQAVKMKIDFEKWKHVTELMSEMKETAARIDFIKAQTIQIIAEVGMEKARLQVETFEKVIDSLNTHNEMVERRIQLMMGAQDGSTTGEGLGADAAKPALPSPAGNAPAQSLGANGPVG